MHWQHTSPPNPTTLNRLPSLLCVTLFTVWLIARKFRTLFVLLQICIFYFIFFSDYCSCVYSAAELCTSHPFLFPRLHWVGDALYHIVREDCDSKRHSTLYSCEHMWHQWTLWELRDFRDGDGAGTNCLCLLLRLPLQHWGSFVSAVVIITVNIQPLAAISPFWTPVNVMYKDIGVWRVRNTVVTDSDPRTAIYLLDK